MTNYAIETPPVVALPIAGTDALFPVRRVYCIGRNYAAHAVEMGHDPDREPPFFFQKNPNKSSDVHHEIEMLVALKSGGTDIPIAKALDHVYGYDLNQMIWKVSEMIAYLSEYFELAAGDVIMSGTPAGVAAVQKGDVMTMHIAGLGHMEVKVV